MDRESYFEMDGLSHSGMTDLAVSPMRYWHRHINPERPPDEPTAEMRFGSAVHCAILEPEEFEKRYCAEVQIPEGALDTVADLRAWLIARGEKPKGTLKRDLISQVCALDATAVPIVALIEEDHALLNAGKVMFKAEAWKRIQGCVEALRAEPEFMGFLNLEGESEKEYTVKCSDTGVPLKAMMDWVTKYFTLDIKTISAFRGKNFDKAIADAIWYQSYCRQAYLYTMIRRLCGESPKEFIFAFVESEPPHEVRLRSLTPRSDLGVVNLYWEQSRIQVRELIALYAKCKERFGNAPWRDEQAVARLEDQEIQGLSY